MIEKNRQKAWDFIRSIDPKNFIYLSISGAYHVLQERSGHEIIKKISIFPSIRQTQDSFVADIKGMVEDCGFEFKSDLD